MPVLLDPASAIPLDSLLAEVQTQGLEWRIEASSIPSIAGIGSLSTAGPLELSFVASNQYVAQLPTTRAGAVIVTPEVAASLAPDTSFARVVCTHPYLLYARVSQWFARHVQPRPEPGVHPTAVVADDATVAASAVIGAHAVIESGAVIEDQCQIGAGCFIGRGSRIGAGSLLHPRVTVYAGVQVGSRAIIHGGAVLGADGFGFAPDTASEQPGAWVKIAQLGGVIIGDDVEIGANTTIDRGALEDTVIGDGVKLDNQIMIAHNVHIGDHTAIAACVGIAGSTRIGARCTIGGAAMLGGHLTLGDDVHISGGTSVISNIEKPGRYTSVFPLSEHSEWQRNAAVIPQLSRLRRRVQALERRLEQDNSDS